MKSVVIVAVIILAAIGVYVGFYVLPQHDNSNTTPVVQSGALDVATQTGAANNESGGILTGETTTHNGSVAPVTGDATTQSTGPMVSATQADVKTASQVNATSSMNDQTIHTATPQKTWTNYTKPSDSAIKAMLTSPQYQVTQQEGTEQPYKNAYWDNHAAGIYVDIVSGEPLFSSIDKYDSQTGWPSFTKPLVAANVITKTDADGSRTEVRSAHANSHLGHLFDDGPSPLGTRYCMNSASMKFIAAADLEKEGYGEFSYLFK